MKNLIIISAPSGAGKTTLCRSIQAEIPKIKWSLSFTTRKKGKWKKMVLITSLFRNQLLKTLLIILFLQNGKKFMGFIMVLQKIR